MNLCKARSVEAFWSLRVCAYQEGKVPSVLQQCTKLKLSSSQGRWQWEGWSRWKTAEEMQVSKGVLKKGFSPGVSCSHCLPNHATSLDSAWEIIT